MVDIKREDITLYDWTKGISADEFTGGSYYYADWIQSGYSTKGFKLWPLTRVHTLNNRTNWYPLAVCPCKDFATDWTNFLAFTKDWYLEMGGTYNGSEDWEWDENGWGAIRQERGYDWVGGYVYGDYALCMINNKIKKIDYRHTYDIEYWEWLTNPTFDNNAQDWTVGTGWTHTDDWMEHETGNTGTLEATGTATSTWTGRFAVKIVWSTQWSVTISTSLWWDILTTEAWRNGRFAWYEINVFDEASVTITLTPTSDFDWIVEAVNFHVYDDTGVEEYINWLTTANKHLAIEYGGDIYISSGNKIDILSTLDWKISDTKEICRKDEEIVAMTTQGDSLVIWATNGINSSQYYWNWVDNWPTECIKWRGQVIKAVSSTETISYVLTGSWASSGTAYRLYSVSGYQRSLIASNAFKIQNDQRNLDHYHPSKKFAFNDVQGSESMCIYLENLYLPGCDWIYQFGQTLPWLANSWSRPIKYANWATRLFVYQTGGVLEFAYRLNTRNYYASVASEYYNDKWYLVTDSIYWDKLGTRKAIEKLKLGYKSMASRYGKINIYAIVDDDYFWRFDVSGVTNRPAIWDVYTVAYRTNAEVIKIEKTNSTSGTITFRTTENKGSTNKAERYLEKVSGDGDNQLDSHNNYDNMCLIKTIETEQQQYGSDLIFGKDFVNNYMPYWHKLQLVIEIEKKTTGDTTGKDYMSPEIYELSMVSDITDVTL